MVRHPANPAHLLKQKSLKSVHPSMASASSSSIQKVFKYDVFLSFRGEDTRKIFVDHLYHALDNKGIRTYKDDVRIEKGEKISDQLLRSIEESRFHIIVFSKNYAGSSWCLQELVKIMKCIQQQMKEHTAYPIFYDVEPTEVRNQSGAVGEAFAKHVEKQDAVKWRVALKEAADLAGWDLKNMFDGYEAKLIKKCVQEISLQPHFIRLSIDGKLVGMDTRVKRVVSALELHMNDVRMIGIWGMGGGGKTTLARAVFDNISMRFDEGKSFVENVREVSKGAGLKKLQKQVLRDVLNDKRINVQSVHDGRNMMKKMMSGRKVLVVLDDVDHVDQFEALAGDLDWFKTGSRIIITTRDKQVLVAHGVHSENILDVSLLSPEEAICLFSRYAFRTDFPSQGYEELSKKLVYYAAGLPLTIKVLGSFLKGRSERDWEVVIERLETIPPKETLEKLELSYDGLDDDYKEIFLEIACMLKNEKKDVAIRLLECYGFKAQIGLGVLEERSLLTISSFNTLQLHDQIEKMGRNIVRRVSADPSKHSRLWVEEEVKYILENELGTEATKSMKVEILNFPTEIIMKGLKKMKDLKFLLVDVEDSNRDIDQANYKCQYLPDSLRLLFWNSYPSWCLPKTFEANMLVNLKMPYSNISQLWEGDEIKVLNKLKFMDLCSTKLKTFDLQITPELESLDLSNCEEFVELHVPVRHLKLNFLDLSGSKVSKFNLGLTPCLQSLNLGYCYNFVKLHVPVGHVKLNFLDLSSSKVSKFNLGLTPCLESLNLAYCGDFVELQIPIQSPKLKFLDLRMTKVVDINLHLIPNLENLNLSDCKDFVELHIPTESLKLKFLDLSRSKVINLNLELIPNLESLDLSCCEEFVELHMPLECLKLSLLVLTETKVSSLTLGLTPNLKSLKLNRCNDFLELHMPLECQNLIFLDLSETKVSSLNLGLTPNLESLGLEGCYYLQEIHAPMGCLEKLGYLNLIGCLRFQDVIFCESSNLPGLESYCRLSLIADPLDMCPLHPNSTLPKFHFKCEYIDETWSLPKFIAFSLCACTNIESFSASICGLQQLKDLNLEAGIPEVPKDLGQLESLKILSLLMKEIKHLPDSLCMLKHLRYLSLKSCCLLEKLPNDIGRLECLETLDLTECRSLQDIPNSIWSMKCLHDLNLSFCIRVKKLPEQLGLLECLKLLHIEGAGVGCLPQSIFQIKGLCIFGFRCQLELSGFTSLRERYSGTFEAYIESQGCSDVLSGN